MDLRNQLALPILPLLFVAIGCVHPGEIDATLINRYQRAVAARAGQLREGSKGLSSLRPVSQQAGGPLKTEDVIDSKIVETTIRHQLIEDLGPNKRVRRTERIKTTLLLRDLETGKFPDVEVGEQSGTTEIIETTHVYKPLDAKGAKGPKRQARLTATVRVTTLAGPGTGKITVRTEAESLGTGKIVGTARIEKSYRLLGDEQWRKRYEVKTTVTRAGKTDTHTAEEVGEFKPRDRLTIEVVREQDVTVQGEPADTRVVETFSQADVITREKLKDAHTVQVYRVGAETRTPSMMDSTRKLVHLSLDEAILRALANNLDIREVSYDPAIAREDMTRAAAVFDYTLFGATNYAKDEKKSVSTLVGDITRLRNWSLGVRKRTVTGAEWALEWRMSRSWDTALYNRLFETRYEPEMLLQISQPLLREAWPQFNLAQLRITRLNTKITEADFRAKVEEIVALVTAEYWALVQARENLRIRQRLLDSTRRSHTRVWWRQIIDATKATVKQVEASVKRYEADLVLAQSHIPTVQDRLARLLASPEINVVSRNEVLPLTPMVSERVQLDPTEQLLTALRHNPLLAQARLAIAASEINVSVAKNQALPKLDLTASTGVQGLAPTIQQANDKLLTGNYVSYSIGLVLEYPVGNRDRRANLRQRQHERTKAIVGMQNTADQIAVAIYEQVRRIATAYHEMKARHEALEATRIELQALEDTERIRARLTPEFLRTKLQTQEQLTREEEVELAARVAYNTAIAELERTTGTILEMHRVRMPMSAVAEGGPWPAAKP